MNNSYNGFSRPLLALILGQISLHSCMSGMRMAAPLQALTQGRSAWAVGVLMSLFAVAPIALALPSGRMADRYGYHRPLYIAVALSVTGGVIAVLANHYLLMCLAAALTGAGSNVGLITIQRTAGRMAGSSAERMRIFSWLGIAPALANFFGPVTAGTMIDLAGFRAAYVVLTLMPFLAFYWASQVPRDKPVQAPASNGPRAKKPAAWDLLRSPGLRNLLLLNWVMSASWDVHGFVLPILGHERGLSASAIGSILGAFAIAIAGVRVLIPIVAHRLSEAQVLAGAMFSTAVIFAIYPLMSSQWTMGACAIFLGMALGSVQPMIMSAMHEVTPDDRHGEAVALRSVVINMSSSVMPLGFGVVGAALGASALFWVMGVAVAIGGFAATRLKPDG